MKITSGYICRIILFVGLLPLMGCSRADEEIEVQLPERSVAFQQAYREGLDLLERYRLREAGRAFERCIDLDREAYEGYWQLGRLQLMQGRIEEGIKTLKKALALEPGLTAAQELILETYLGRGREALEEGRFAEARAFFDGALSADPHGYEPLYQSEITAIWQKDYIRADSLLRVAVERHPSVLKLKWHLKYVQQELNREVDDLPEPLRFPDAVERAAEAVDDVGWHFTDIAHSVGVAKFDGGRSSAWADYDDDGDLDLVVLGHPVLAYYRNDGDRFTDITESSGLLLPEGGIAVQCADYDNDGDADLYVTRDGWFGAGKSHLYQNDGRGVFTDVTDAAGIDDPGSSFCAAWGDFDCDGWLDIYVASGTGATGDSTNVLYRNNGDGTFTDVATKAGVAHRGEGLSAAFGDFDGDGYPDIYLCNFTQPNVLYHNNGDGSFADVTEEAGVAAAHIDAFITFLLDYNNDGLLDIFVGNWSQYEAVLEDRVAGRATQEKDQPVLYRNNGDGTFTDVTDAAGLALALGTMSGVPGDVDNDGFVDIFLGNGGPKMGRWESDTLYRNRGDGTFEEITNQVGVAHMGKSHGVTFADFDEDGDLDLYVPVGGARPGDLWENVFYRNEGLGNNHWLIVELEGTRSNRDGIGAKVRVTAGDLFQYAEVASGYSFGCSNSLELEFGLGSHTQVDQIEVEWPSGQVDVYRNLSVDRRLALVEGAKTPMRVK